ncbi:MAG: hypothetical protein AAFT19_07700 [Pseudomonadota bacterium]
MALFVHGDGARALPRQDALQTMTTALTRQSRSGIDRSPKASVRAVMMQPRPKRRQGYGAAQVVIGNGRDCLGINNRRVNHDSRGAGIAAPQELGVRCKNIEYS